MIGYCIYIGCGKITRRLHGRTVAPSENGGTTRAFALHSPSPSHSAHAELHEGASVRPAQARRQQRPEPSPGREHTARRLLVCVQAEAQPRLREHLRSRAWLGRRLGPYVGPSGEGEGKD